MALSLACSLEVSARVSPFDTPKREAAMDREWKRRIYLSAPPIFDPCSSRAKGSTDGRRTESLVCQYGRLSPFGTYCYKRSSTNKTDLARAVFTPHSSGFFHLTQVHPRNRQAIGNGVSSLSLSFIRFGHDNETSAKFGVV